MTPNGILNLLALVAGMLAVAALILGVIELFKSIKKPVTHVPLLELNGKPIKGIKCCKTCGLSQTYWERFPNCTIFPNLKP